MCIEWMNSTNLVVCFPGSCAEIVITTLFGGLLVVTDGSFGVGPASPKDFFVAFGIAQLSL